MDKSTTKVNVVESMVEDAVSMFFWLSFKSYLLATFIVTSLFTNVPIIEAVNII